MLNVFDSIQNHFLFVADHFLASQIVPGKHRRWDRVGIERMRLKAGNSKNRLLSLDAKVTSSSQLFQFLTFTSCLTERKLQLERISSPLSLSPSRVLPDRGLSDCFSNY